MPTIIYGKGKIEAEMAESWKEKALGLRGKEKGSMLFKMKDPSKPLIDMILVKKKLQIIFISEDLKAQEIIHAEPGFNFYKPKQKCKYFLETFSYTNIIEGESLRLKNF